MLQYSDLLNFNWTSKEMNRLLLTFLFLNISLFSSSAFSETNTFQMKQEYSYPNFNKHKSMLAVNANSQEYKFNGQPKDSSNSAAHHQNVDFFEIAKQYQENEAKPSYSTDETVNMSDHERSLYYIRNHDNVNIQREIHGQQFKSLKQQRDKGVISNDVYKEKVYKILSQPSFK
ncbi:hypothetical protein [Acinetobacter sp. yr461]|uniref:hypothetical protein n=1 Tax=Acinetobacter sp. yr461 TaxID=1761742 RepID=UPI0008C702A5|nr:hypothetical protein [Acinetobacter sp. yr461]SEO33965.1 hypothetical protein SAMN04487817_103170 [Acinetobacter sp. yr461]